MRGASFILFSFNLPKSPRGRNSSLPLYKEEKLRVIMCQVWNPGPSHCFHGRYRVVRIDHLPDGKIQGESKSRSRGLGGEAGPQEGPDRES